MFTAFAKFDMNTYWLTYRQRGGTFPVCDLANDLFVFFSPASLANDLSYFSNSCEVDGKVVFSRSMCLNVHSF